MNSTLNDLHNQIESAYKNNSFLEISNKETNNTISFDRKLKINEFFKTIQQQIQTTVKTSQPLPLSLSELEISEIKATLQLLQKDGQLAYDIYKKKKSFHPIKFLIKGVSQFIAKKLFTSHLKTQQTVRVVYQEYNDYFIAQFESLSKLEEKKQVIADLLIKMIQGLDQIKKRPLPSFSFKAKLNKQIPELFNKIDALPLNLDIDSWIKNDPELSCIYPIYQKYQLIKVALACNQELDLIDILKETQWEAPAKELDFALHEWLFDKKVIGNKLEVIQRLKAARINQTQRLDLSGLEINQLPPGLSNLNLQILNLSFNYFQVLSKEIGQLNNLAWLDLSHNQLFMLPEEIGQLIHLRSLKLSHNKLQALPQEIEQLTHLKHLYVAGNVNLKEIPLCMYEMTNLVTFTVEHTGISAEMRNGILASCRAKRNDENSFMSRLKTWYLTSGGLSQEFNSYSASYQALTDIQKNTINEWLFRLEKTKDYQDNQKKLAQVTLDILASVQPNTDFHTLFFDQVESNNSNCQDRAAMALNELYTSWKIYTLGLETASEKLPVLIQAAKTLTLRSVLSELIANEEKIKRSLILESVEIFLYYETLLKKELNLLTVIDQIDYATIGQRKWVNVQLLKEKVNAQYVNFLVDMPAFENLIERDVSFQKMWQPYNQNFYEQLVKLTEHCPNTHDESEEMLKWQELNYKILNERKFFKLEVGKQWLQLYLNNLH